MSWPSSSRFRSQDTVNSALFELEGFIVTGTPRPRSAGTVASFSTVLEGEELRLRGLTGVAEALSEVPGLVMIRSGSYGSATSAFFRGAESDHMKVLVDGVEVNQPGGAFDFSGLSLADVERIEVVRGPASAFYGSDAMAGVIQIITRRGRGPLEASFSTGLGSYGRQNWGTGLHGGAGWGGYSLSYFREETDGILEFNNAFRNTVFSGKIVADPSERLRLGLTGRYADRVFHFPTDGGGHVVDRNAFTFGEELSLSAEAGLRVSDWAELAATFQTYRWDGGSDDRADGPADTLGYFGYLSQDSFRRASGDVRMNLATWEKSVLSFGAEVEREAQESKSESQSQWGPSNGADAFQRWNRGYYAHLVTEASALAWNLGVRLEDNQGYGSFFTYQAGLSYAIPTLGTLLRGSVGKGLKEPTFLETSSSGFSIGNPELEPERSQVWEIGADQLLGQTGIRTSLTWFNQSLRNLIQYTFSSPVAGGPNYFNVAEARIRGAEASLSASLGAWSLSGGYTYLDSRVTDAGFDEGEGAIFVEGAPLIRRPTHQASFGAIHRRPRWTLTGNLRWIGSRYDRDFSWWPASSVRMPSYLLFNVGADMRLFPSAGVRPGMDLQVRVENLLDQEYQELFGFSAPGRAFMVGCEMTFGARGR